MLISIKKKKYLKNLKKKKKLNVKKCFFWFFFFLSPMERLKHKTYWTTNRCTEHSVDEGMKFVKSF